MTKLNHHFQKLRDGYLFSEIEKRVSAHQKKYPQACLLNLGIGDVTHPLFPNVVEALVKASYEMGDIQTFRGYGPSDGYDFLKQAIAQNDYSGIALDEIFISDGINTDISNIQEIFSIENRVGIMDPAYPVYVDVTVMAGRTKPLLKTGGYGGITYFPCSEGNGFQPEVPNAHVDLIFLCSPNNPTGVTMGRENLTKWVRYAREHQAIILFDAAYEAFITSDAPRSIYEIDGAKEVAVEFRSFSKSAGFTGLRCSYTVIPHALKVRDAGKIQSLNQLWKRRLDTKSNGVSYPIQKAAEALYTQTGKRALQETIESYSQRAKILLEGLRKIGYSVYGGLDSPYLWCKTPPKIRSWEFFDFVLENAHVVTVPGFGFGCSGDSFIRFSAFAERDAIEQTLSRFKALA
ncbi:MAG: LL-diaminopimelate aminotransferase [Chlamydiae bacterium RIFCSPHIGHO2_12_FULL_44_59]|nr:MAG: LL-diaminopimelate aminotransferase [Chlamydiae bacterium RIFCSPHIGHO2_01_FULL_44_39]OGN58416.1 MAG: LL-diaminopimelate aminotransferase [Chlamydiae bacterium RIFCSPHIGHO2_02_FULL_45_9]OGN59465.1 MAG: LL-diaminopimelate aminotransferase [Chlamydiae bacterium RIFCSPHIGHO2_12_FULL_44_59]OGN67218.1 MAG: LL-diaminopimelate aminotransferase [Chlamydiae bacterium RIFCSPLOWO2_01_FULL_44_52]OGN67415.1 MAG: LL-diaminopimelate aminotransferase [Chlamydiae bacterium RIFCSPLOWO2_02_FULL_45_22]OGN6